MKESLIELKKISKSFYKGSGYETRALDAVDLFFEKGKWTYIIGGNGSGKSTLLKIISGQIRPDEGKIFFQSGNITQSGDVERFRWFCHVDQHIYNNLIGSMTISENIVLSPGDDASPFPAFKGYSNDACREKIFGGLKEFGLGLENKMDMQVRFLSGGEQQAVVAAKLIFLNPRVMLIDEFTSALDQKLAPVILGILKKNSKLSGNTAIIVTHDFAHIGATGERVIVLDKGRVKGDYSADACTLTPHFLLEKLVG